MEKEKHTISEILGTSLENLKKLVDVDTVIGNPITTHDGVTIIPVSKVHFGFAAGGGDIPTTKTATPFGGGSGGAMTITPLAFLVVSNGTVDLLNISAPANSVDRVVDMVPGLIDKIGVAFAKGRDEKTEPPTPGGDDTTNVLSFDPIEP